MFCNRVLLEKYNPKTDLFLKFQKENSKIKIYDNIKMFSPILCLMTTSNENEFGIYKNYTCYIYIEQNIAPYLKILLHKKEEKREMYLKFLDIETILNEETNFPLILKLKSITYSPGKIDMFEKEIDRYLNKYCFWMSEWIYWITKNKSRRQIKECYANLKQNYNPVFETQ